MSFNVQETVYDTARYEAVKLQIMDYSPDLLGLQEDNISTWGKSENFTLDGYICYKDGSITSGERLAIYVKEGLTVKTSGSVSLTASGMTRALTYDDVKTGGTYELSTELYNQLKALGTGSTEEATVNSALQNGKVYNSTASTSLLGRRHMSYVVVEKDGQEIIYVNMHVQHRSQKSQFGTSVEDATNNNSLYELVQTVRNYERMKSFDIAQAKIESLLLTYPNAEVVITGDFNDTKAGALRDFCGGGADADGVWDAITDQGYSDAALIAKTNGGNLTTTWNSYFTNENGENGQSKEVTDKTPLGSTAGTDGRIDFCFVSDGFGVSCYQTGAPYGKAGENGRLYYISDHLSIITDLTFNKS